MGDPRRPALPIAVEEDEEHVLVQSDGQVRRHYNAIYSEDDTERIRQGYCCINCGESQVDHGAPFPELCWVCKFPIRGRQSERYATEWKGTIRIGPSTSIEEELEIAREHVERENHIAKPSIIVPGGFH